ncbi:MAG: ATP-dependent Clp protease ATP-binding subunit ClpB [Pseudomonadota bacterium]|nr:ATP-dependent Clp protease ATP-binding subunit ClpB [Pseudomonadota bacterium]
MTASLTPPLWPRWIADLHRLLGIRPQFILSGPIRDLFLTPLDSEYVLLPALDSLWEGLAVHGYQFLLIYDRIDGLRVHPHTPAARQLASRTLNHDFQGDASPISLQRLPGILRTLITANVRAAAVIDYASRVPVSVQQLTEAEHEFFTACEKLAQIAHPTLAAPDRIPRFNPILWLCHRENDLPSWFTLDNEAIHRLTIPPPAFEERRHAANLLAPSFADHAQAAPEQHREFADNFAQLTEGLSLHSLFAITQLAEAQALPLAEVTDAVRCFKVGSLDNPWKQGYLRPRIQTAAEVIGQRVKGQQPAIIKTVDILMRSVMGLTGAHTAATSSRPRGVLFFAGPTGVGKTELARALTALLFNDERAYLRFDMSEFAAEHADARLLGAPPGYVGYDAGGELTNAVRARPFSVILFDEIEKAHPRILDKFLQIFEDGRLTDGRGDTVYFSEAILIFTSNLGITVEDDTGQRRLRVQPGEPYEQVERQVRAAISDYFKFTLGRPEILNRIGDNIVVFDFIQPAIAEQIFAGMLNRVAQRMTDEHNLTLIIPEPVRQQLLAWCTHDLSDGGRGIGNRLETAFINPLARALFHWPMEQPGQSLTVTTVRLENHVYSVELA